MSNQISKFQHNDPNALEMTGFNVIEKAYWRVRALFAELGQSDTVLKRALKEGHGIDLEGKSVDTMLYFTQSQQQMDAMHEAGIKSPTFLQILGSSEVVALSEEDAITKYPALKQDH